jgi:hypothetical protein
VREDGGAAVRKTFHAGPPELRAAQARAEYERLQRFAAALAGVPGAACPQPLELLHDPPGVRMSHAAGEDLFAWLAHGRLDARERARLAGVMAAALVAYVGACGEPLPDFKFDNLLYDAAAGTLTFVDLGAPQDAVAPEPGLSPYEVMAGDLLGSLVFQSARPRHALPRRRYAATAALARALVDALADAGAAPLRPEAIARAGRAAYRRCAYGRSARRSAWYAIAGPLLGRRVRLDGASVGPVAPR